MPKGRLNIAIPCDTEAQRNAVSSPDFADRIVSELRRCGIDATRATESEIKKALVVISKDDRKVKE